MVAVRIYALAKQLKVDSKILVDTCTKAGITGKGSALASLTDEEEAKVREVFESGKRPVARAAKPGAVKKPLDDGPLKREDYIAPAGGAAGKMPVLAGKPKPEKPAKKTEVEEVSAEVAEPVVLEPVEDEEQDAVEVVGLSPERAAAQAAALAALEAARVAEQAVKDAAAQEVVAKEAAAAAAQEAARAAEQAGFHGIAVSDSICYPQEASSKYPYNADGSRDFLESVPFVESLISVAAMAAVTERIRFATFVYKLAVRQAPVVAKQVQGIQTLSGNRFDFGIGISPWEEDFAVCEVPWQKRGKRFDEQIEILRGLESGRADGEGAPSAGRRDGTVTLLEAFNWATRQTALWTVRQTSAPEGWIVEGRESIAVFEALNAGPDGTPAVRKLSPASTPVDDDPDLPLRPTGGVIGEYWYTTAAWSPSFEIRVPLLLPSW